MRESRLPVFVSRAWVLFIILIALLTLALFGCANTYMTNEEMEIEADQPTFKGRVDKSPYNNLIQIYLYQGHEYVFNQKGGLLHSVSCPVENENSTEAFIRIGHIEVGP